MRNHLERLRCKKCGSVAIYSRRWVNANTDEINDSISPVDESKEENQFWCKECHDYTQPTLLYDLWKEFSKIEIDDNGNIQDDFIKFHKGTPKNHVLFWFNSNCPVGIHTDLISKYNKENEV